MVCRDRVFEGHGAVHGVSYIEPGTRQFCVSNPRSLCSIYKYLLWPWCWCYRLETNNLPFLVTAAAAAVQVPSPCGWPQCRSGCCL
jgi:hypothetical protein